MSEFLPPVRLRGIEKSPIRQLFDRAPPGSINLGLGEPDLPTPDVIRRAAARVVVEEQNGYTTHAGLPALRERVASDYEHLGATPERIIITAGSQEALYIALMSLVDVGDEVLIPDPGFVAYPTIVRMAGGQPVFYRMPAARDFAFDVDDFKQQLSPRTKVVVCISPSNPTGRTLSEDELSSMANALEGTGILVLSDEIYRELYYTETKPASIADYYPQTIIISGLSKSLSMAGWRIGWLFAEDSAVRGALILHGYVTTCASTVSQKAALAAWTNEAEEARRAARLTFRERRDHLMKLLAEEAGLEAVRPDGAFYVMVKTGGIASSMEVAEAALSKGVITVPGSAFGGEGEGFLRLSFCANHAVLAEGVRRLSSALQSLKRD